MGSPIASTIAGPVALLAMAGLLVGCEGIAPVDGAAEARLLAERGKLRIAVYPTILRRDTISHDADSARRLADELERAGLARVEVSADEVPVTAGWTPNQAAMWNRSLAEFRGWLAAHPAGADHLLLVECLLQPNDLLAGVHVYLVDREGRVALRRLYNSHREEFKAVARRGLSGCTDLALQTLGRALAPPVR
jgi:hypothetical protein